MQLEMISTDGLELVPPVVIGELGEAASRDVAELVGADFGLSQKATTNQVHAHA